MTYSGKRGESKNIGNGCAVRFWSRAIMAGVNNAVLVIAVMKSESVSHGFIC